ncbi:lipopolysaccharide biosynthesis protein [Streptomyces sp. NPDC004609]|uniref:lipopolysaccharide biosynthesis protein n=1 Tax=Streptomyces sp. NPDC004609 TaxID=3364704 RepID=UPI0036D0AF5F
MSDIETTRLRKLPESADTTRLRKLPESAALPGAPAADEPEGDRPEGDDSGHGQDSLFRNAYALMLSTGVSAALGLGFWLVAARYYTKDAVGEGSAAIAAMRLLASITATTMTGAVVRYVPRAGRATGPLVWRTYLFSSAVVLVASVVFLLTLDLWGPSYEPLRGLWPGLCFAAAAVSWALLTLQDGVLTGLRRAFWVPIGNAVFSVGKLVLLAVFASALPVLGIFVSWALAMALSIVPLAWLIFRRLIPQQAAADRDREPPRMKEIGRFLAGDSFGALFSMAMINLLPVMVAVRFDATHNGYFYIAYTVGGTMEFMAMNMASSLTAHASHSPETLAAGVRGALRRMTLLLVPVVLVLVVFAPLILAPFGSAYADNSSTVLRLLAAAALPRVAVELYIGVLRVQGRTGMLAVIQGTMCVLVLGSATLLFGPTGISGAGWAMLLSMTLMAVVCAPGLRAALSGREPEPSKLWARLVARGPEKEIEYGTNWARKAAERRERLAKDEQEYGTAAYVWSGHDTATPAFGIPVFVPPERAAERPAAPPDTDEDRLTVWLWLVLGLAAGLFWVPLSRAEDLGRASLLGGELLGALPPVSLTAGILLVIAYCAAVALQRPRPVLVGTILVVTVAALYTGPLLLGLHLDQAGDAWTRALGDFLAAAAGLDSPSSILRALPVVLQVLCLALAAVTLRKLGANEQVTAVVVWVLAVAGWAAQDAMAAGALPVFAGFATVYAVAVWWASRE